MSKGLGPLSLIIVMSAIISALAFFFYAFKIAITTVQFIVVMLLVLIVPVIVLVGKFIANWKPTAVVNRDIEKAQQIAEEFWLRNRHQQLTLVDGIGGERDLGEKFYGFLFIRERKGFQAGMPVTLIVGKSPWRVAWWNDYPSPEEMEDPFAKFSTGYRGKPSSKFRPEEEPQIIMEKYRKSRSPLVGVYPSQKKKRRLFYGEGEERE